MDFRTAIDKATQLLEQTEAQPDNLSERQLLPFFESEEPARGFFVAFLTGSWKSVAEPPAVLLSVFRQRSVPVYSLLIRSLVMSAATEAAHRRNGELERAAQSARVCEQTSRLIERVNDGALFQELAEMRKTLIGESDSYVEFLARVHYSDDEKLAALCAVEQAMAQAKGKESEGPLNLDDPFG